jgi:hypothetical protein
MTKRIRRASGTRTFVDVVRHFTRSSFAERKAADMEAVQNGESRLVRCYVKPDSNEKRRQWKPGYLELSAGKVLWRGSSRKWPNLLFVASEWRLSLRKVRQEEHVYKSWSVIECKRGSEVVSLAVPKLDAELCLFALERQE